MNTEAKFLLSYGGNNKILHVNRGINFEDMVATISALLDGAGVHSFKYQIPGDDLGILITVTNDRDLRYMMLEFDRLDPPSTTPDLMRIFPFPQNLSPPTLISVPAEPDPVDNVAVVPPPRVERVAPPPEYQLRVAVNTSDQAVAPDPRVNHALVGRWRLQRWSVVGRASSFSSFLLGPLTPALACLLIALPLLLVPFTLELRHRSSMDVGGELKNVGIIAEPGPDHVDKPTNHWSPQCHQSLPDKAGGGLVYAPTDEKETTFHRPWGPTEAKTGCAEAVSSSRFDPSTAEDFYVFISFRGNDTRFNFVCHLHQALTREEIKVLIDYKFPRGDKIWPSILRAVENSYVSVVVFSENYASSKWCLEELVKILESRKEKGQVVLPVFYNIDPAHVRHQLGSFKEAFDTHLQNVDQKVVQNWKAALTEAADLIGWASQSRYTRDDAELVQQIVKAVLEKRNHHCKSNARRSVVGIYKQE